MVIPSLISKLIDEAICQSTLREQRSYLGASILGLSCSRQIQFNMRGVKQDNEYSAQTLRIFERGHLFEELVAKYLTTAHFTIKRQAITFKEGNFQGTIDGLITDGPKIEGLEYPFIWENKAVSSKSFKVLTAIAPLHERNLQYATQIAVYQVMCNKQNPALFTVVNSDTMEIHAEFVPLDNEFAQKALDKAYHILEAKNDEWLPRISENSDYFTCRMCSYRNTCFKEEY